jgi:hypothetical protein
MPTITRRWAARKLQAAAIRRKPYTRPTVTAGLIDHEHLIDALCARNPRM